ncbi:MAG TPA: S41 family peptidase [Bryobacteraceae bacterium]|nr:S41 family peptidase [Bryobacteraceae bacterium]
MPRIALLFLTAACLHAEEELDASVRKIFDVLAAVSAHGADPVDSERAFYGGLIPGMLRRLDPHSAFLDPDQFTQLKRMQRSESKGFGSVVSILPGRVIVLQTLPGTPMQRSGISAGDEILAINNIALAPLTPEQLVQVLSQARQGQALVHVRKPGNMRPLQFTLTPQEMQAPSVERAFLLEEGAGYIRVASFDENTARDLQTAIEKLGGKKLKSLVLDLRNNPGGAVSSALDAASLFLQPGQVILSAKGRRVQAEEKVPASADPYTFSLAVVVSEKTASAAEILSGALQDHDRAVIVGDATFGKGLVQNVMPLREGTALALTTAFYYTPSGRSIQKPLHGMQLEESTQKPAETFRTDNGRAVRGGGGIEPDVAVQAPVTTRLVQFLEGSGAYTLFATEYLRTRPAITAKFTAPPEMLDKFRAFLSQNRVQPTIGEWFSSADWISYRLRQEIVNQALGVEMGDEIEAEREPYIQAALAAVRKP